MSFWLNDSMFVVYTRQIQTKYRFMLSIFLVLFISLGWFFLFYVPARDKICKLQPQIKDLQNQALNLETVIKTFDKERQLSENLNLKIKQFNDLSIDNKVFSDHLIKILSRYNISCSVVSPLFTKTNKCFLKNYFHVVFKCSYKDFCAFCNDTAVLCKPLKFCYLKIVRWKDGKIKADAVFRNISVVNS